MKMKKNFTTAEKQSFKKGLFVGLRKSHKLPKKKIANKPSKVGVSQKPVFLGPTYVNGKYYDTNFKNPKPFTRKEIEWARKEFSGGDYKLSKAQAVDCMVNYYKKKFGWFNRDGQFGGYLGDE